MHIDESGRHDQARGIYTAPGGLPALPHGNDAPVTDAYVRSTPLGARSVDQGPATYR